jgi:predicted phosphodiesterase
MVIMELKIPEKYKDLYVVGDIHGEFKELVYVLTQRYQIKDAVVIVAGDCGFGFEKPSHYLGLYEGKLEKRLKNSNIMILCVRGNHDDPEYYNGELRPDWEYLKCLPDYSSLWWGSREILVVGGAVSVDQDWRIQENAIQERLGSSKRVWWPSEIPLELGDLGIQKLPGHVFMVVSHDAPISMMPVLARDTVNVRTGDLFESILESREYLEKILWRCKPDRWYYGHHHTSWAGTNGGTLWRGLGIMEVVQVPLVDECQRSDGVEASSTEGEEKEKETKE